MYKCTLRTRVISENYRLEPDGYSSIKIKNNGDKNMLINTNITLAPNTEWKLRNDPGTVIDFAFFISFYGAGTAPKALIELIYFTKK